jgi:hypothetical protein
VIVFPGAGFCDTAGKFTRGVSIDSTSEVDVVNRYMQTFVEILDEYNICHDIIPTRNPPGVPLDTRLRDEKPNCVQVELTVGFFPARSESSRRTYNESRVEFHGDTVRPLADLLAEVLGEWGRCCAYGHRAQKPRESNDICEGSIRILPFSLNGPESGTYLRRLVELGNELGICFVEHFHDTGSAKSGHMARYWR